MLHKFYHIIGHKKKDGTLEYKALYKIERAIFSVRQMVAFIICPELRVKADEKQEHLDYVITLWKRHTKELHAKERAYSRLRQQVKDLNQKIRELQQ